VQVSEQSYRIYKVVGFLLIPDSGGQPFVYSRDVNTGNYNLLVNFMPTLSNVESAYDEG
jgi:hypothetical protein